MNNMNANPAGQAPDARGLLMRSIALASSNLMIFAVLTVVNMVLVACNADISFSFSAEIPPFLAILGISAISGSGLAAAGILLILLSLVSVGFIFLCSVMTKKHPGWLIASLVCLIVDTVFSAWVYIRAMAAEKSFVTSAVIAAAFHIWMIYYIVKGISAASKLKRLPPEPMTYDVPFTAAPENGQPYDGTQTFTDGTQSGNYPPEGQNDTTGGSTPTGNNNGENIGQ